MAAVCASHKKLITASTTKMQTTDTSGSTGKVLVNSKAVAVKTQNVEDGVLANHWACVASPNVSWVFANGGCE